MVGALAEPAEIVAMPQGDGRVAMFTKTGWARCWKVVGDAPSLSAWVCGMHLARQENENGFGGERRWVMGKSKMTTYDEGRRTIKQHKTPAGDGWGWL
jgi:hypothetical protein